MDVLPQRAGGVGRAALRQRRIPVEYMVKDNEGHSLARRENQIEFCARVVRFLERELR